MIQPPPLGKVVLIVDDDRDIAEVVQTILLDEGFKVSCLYEPSADAVRVAIDALDPACVLLDGAHGALYGASWEIAEWLATRPRPIAAVMLTGHAADRDEATKDESPRAKTAHFAGVIPKPFDIDQLVVTVRRAIGEHIPESTEREEAEDQRQLMARLTAAGAEELRGSKMGRVWATFRAGPERTLFKVYRWRAAGVYFVGRYSADGAQLAPLGQFPDLDSLIAYVLGRIKEGGRW